MNTITTEPQTPQMVMPLTLLIVTALFIYGTANAHEVIGADGLPTHAHVYKRTVNGNGVIAGHIARPVGSHGIVIWQTAPEQNYRQAQPGMYIPSQPWARKHQISGQSSGRKSGQRTGQRPSQKQMYRQKPAFIKKQNRTPDLNPQ